MKKEDIEFLRELQNELRTQDHDCQAAPRYWGVVETARFPTSEEYADSSVIYNSHSCQEVEKNDLIELMEESWDKVEHDIFEKDDLKSMSIGEAVCCANDDFGWHEYEVVFYMDKELVTTQTGCFLTKRACQRHIELNSYHYCKPHTYAMTAWRNPEFERLLDILTNMNLDDIKEE